MQLFIMRHGEASYDGKTDADRPLTEQGKLEAVFMAKWLSSMKVELNQVFTSPYVRAQQTVNILLTTLQTSVKATVLNFITPDGSAQHAHDFIDGIGANADESILIVSHMPLVSYLVEELTFERQSPIFQTAGIVEIDYDIEKMKGNFVRLICPLDLC